MKSYVLDSDQDLASVIASVRGDVVHPALFYLALKYLIALGGDSVLWLKLLPAVFFDRPDPSARLLCLELKMRAQRST